MSKSVVLKSLVDYGSTDSSLTLYCSDQHLLHMAFHVLSNFDIDGTSNSVISQALDLQIAFLPGNPESDILCHSVGPALHDCTRILLAHPLQSLV